MSTNLCMRTTLRSWPYGMFVFYFAEAINRYREVNENAFPNRIIIYRDGMGEEDQSAGVFEDELRMIKVKSFIFVCNE